MSITIYKATEKDIPDIIELNHLLFLHDLPNDKHLFIDWPYSDVGKEYFHKAITKDNYYTVIAKDEEKNKVVGYLIGYLWSHWTSRPIKTAEIDNILILDGYRGKNIGKNLINKFKQWCKEKDVKNLVVMAYTKNTEALKFYKKVGFEDLSTRLVQEI